MLLNLYRHNYKKISRTFLRTFKAENLKTLLCQKIDVHSNDINNNSNNNNTNSIKGYKHVPHLKSIKHTVINISYREKVKVYCPMEFYDFPMDKQTCELSFESCKFYLNTRFNILFLGQDSLIRLSFSPLMCINVHLLLLNTVQWLSDFKQFDWFGGHRSSYSSD